VWTGEEFAVVYGLSSGGDYEVYLRRIAPDGTLLSGDVQVTFDETDSWPADLCWNGSEYGMVWHDGDNTGNIELWFRSLDALGNAGPALPLTVDDPEISEFPDLVWTGTEYALVWEDLRNFFFQVFFTRVGCDCSEDADGDLVSVCNDCDEGQSATYPGAPQVCDGANNDCSHPSYPDLIGTNELDDDGDGTSECAGDCDDADMTVYSGAPEVNDGVDNQCPGNVGYGSVDETSGDSGFHTAGDTSLYDWPAQAGATQYEVARSENPEFGGCIAVVVAEPAWMDPDLPAEGAAYYYLNRPLSPNAGSWGQDSAGGERAPDCL
jgi:hypothetical protein